MTQVLRRDSTSALGERGTPLTIAACYLSPEGVVFGTDSTASFQTPDGFHYLNHAQKLFEIGESATLGMIVWGLGGLQKTSHRTLAAQLADSLTTDALGTVSEVMDRWIDQFWAAYTAEQAASIARAKALDAMPPHDPTGATAGCRSKDEDDEYAQLVVGLGVGFCIGGYVLPDRTPSAYVVVFEPLKPKPSAVAVQMDGAGFWGVPNMVTRLLHGADAQLRQEILASGHWSGNAADLDAILARFVLGGLRLPIRDAIDFVYSYIFSTIKAFKFSNMAQVCGGPVELAVIRTDRPFQWVKHKPWHAALEEGAIR